MKKIIFIFTLASCMLFSSGMAVMAHSFYLDGMFGGKWKTGTNEDGLSAYTLGGEYFIGSKSKIKIGGEYTCGTEESYGDDGGFTAFLIKGGYQIFSNRQFRVDGTLAYYNRNYSEMDEAADGVLAGIDAFIQLNQKSYIQGSFGYSLTGKFGEDANLTMADGKYVYRFQKRFGASVGYRYVKIGDKETDGYLDHSGPTIGVILDF
jgi:hypothetical protein